MVAPMLVNVPRRITVDDLDPTNRFQKLHAVRAAAFSRPSTSATILYVIRVAMIATP